LKYSEMLYHQAMLIEGYELENPVEFSSLLSEMMVAAYNK
jgi:HSP90 family molecular chaperone